MDDVLRPPRRECHVWWARRDDATESLRELLGAAERDRLARLRRQPDKDRFMVACATLRLAAAEYFGAAPAEIPVTRTCPDCGKPHGKPRVALPSARDAEISVSHSGERVVVAFATGTPVGVDVEQMQPGLRVAGLARQALSSAEADEVLRLQGSERSRAFLVRWTRKEAVLKALGLGLSAELRGVEVTGPGSPPRLLAWPADPTLPNRLRMYELAAGPDHLACLAVIGECDRVVELDGSALIRRWRERSPSRAAPTGSPGGLAQSR